MSLGRELAFYLHVPFCASRCGYCDFNTYTAAELGTDQARISKDTWAEFAAREIALARESEHLATDERVISTVFFGGGTPTLVPPTHLVATLNELRNEFGLRSDVEVTTEANPDSIDSYGLAELRGGGFTRVSFGHQSSAASVLRVLERSHTPGRTLRAVSDARAAGFEHINIDLIYATPGETDDDLSRTLEDVIASGADHVSAYSLIVEPGTKLAAQVRRGELPAPDDDIAAQRYQLIDATLSAAGFQWYEVSNWAKPGGECRHNMVYWHNDDWWGVGPGAHSHMAGERWWNHKHPARWSAELLAGQLPIAGSELVSAASQEIEKVMLGLRMREGIALTALADVVRPRLEPLVAQGLLDVTSLAAGRAVLTDSGRLLADAVVRDLTP